MREHGRGCPSDYRKILQGVCNADAKAIGDGFSGCANSSNEEGSGDAIDNFDSCNPVQQVSAARRVAKRLHILPKQCGP
jgi:hypothetical protein